MSSPSSPFSPVGTNVTTPHVILEIVDALAGVVDGTLSRNMDALASVEPSASGLGALCGVVAEMVPVLVHTASSAPTRSRHLCNDSRFSAL